MIDLSNLSVEGVAVKLAGLAGAVVSMRFLQGSLKERAFLAASGMVFSFYASPFMSKISGLPEGLSGFLLGLFGMALVSKAWEVIQTLPLGVLVIDALRKLFRLEKKEGQ